jgi:hypothetical protein
MMHPLYVNVGVFKVKARIETSRFSWVFSAFRPVDIEHRGNALVVLSTLLR